MRILHTMVRVGDLERSLAFYTEVLGMRLISRKEYPTGRFTLAFVGYGQNPDHAELELTHNWDQGRYELGTAYGHIALGTDDITADVERIRKGGGKVTREPGPMKGGTTIIAFVEDPDGYKIELIDNASRAARLDGASPAENRSVVGRLSIASFFLDDSYTFDQLAPSSSPAARDQSHG